MKNILASRLTGRVLSAAMGVGLLAVLIMGSAGTALAGTSGGGNGMFTISGAALSETVGDITINAVTLNGTDQTIPIGLPITVTDPRGTGAGWNVTIAATQFNGSATNSPNHLPPPRVGTPTATPATGTTATTSTAPVNNASTNFDVPFSGTSGKLYNAATNSGLGKFDLDPDLTVLVPANAIQDTYSSTFTVAVAATP